MFSYLEKVVNSINTQCQKLEGTVPLKWLGRTLTPSFKSCPTLHPYAKISLAVGTCFIALGVGFFAGYRSKLFGINKQHQKLNGRLRKNRHLSKSNHDLVTQHAQLVAANKLLTSKNKQSIPKNIN